ncbi:MAG TPA: SAM-dependent methyltransferase [Rugosimonospora sp.]|nr:SAM-dependent methyltransferase [Rugosimonospora sp.]
MNDQPNDGPRPSIAGVYDAALGGTENTAPDRALVERARIAMPHIIEGAWANRGFLQRAVTRMAGPWGIRQFIDVGAGMPTQRNTHEVAAEVRPDARVLYVDNDPQVIARAGQLLVDADHTAVILGDLRDPDTILSHPVTHRLIDFTQPVGLLVVAVVHFIPDTDNPWGAVARLMAALPSGSYLALSSVTSDRQEETWEAVKQQVNPAGYDGHPRTRAQVEHFFTGLDIAPPYEGARAEVANIGLWGAEDPDQADDDASHLSYAAVARKP